MIKPQKKMDDDLKIRTDSIKDETRNDIKELLSFLCMQEPINDKKVVLHVKRLSDGIDDSDSYLEKKFVTGKIGMQSATLSFDYMPVSASIETYEYPLVLISDENEIDENIRKRIIKRKEKKYVSFLVIVFCDDFFTVRDGESFGYINIIESIEEACGDNCKAMAFKMSDMKKGNAFVYAYMNYLDMVLHVDELIAEPYLNNSYMHKQKHFPSSYQTS